MYRSRSRRLCLSLSHGLSLFVSVPLGSRYLIHSSAPHARRGGVGDHVSRTLGRHVQRQAYGDAQAGGQLHIWVYASSILNQGHMRRLGDAHKNIQKQVYAEAYAVYIYALSKRDSWVYAKVYAAYIYICDSDFCAGTSPINPYP